MNENKICCNNCGRKLHSKGNIILEDSLAVRKEWGYFSDKDLEVHEFILCEECYNSLINQFINPVTISKKNEVLQD